MLPADTLLTERDDLSWPVVSPGMGTNLRSVSGLIMTTLEIVREAMLTI